MQRRDVKYLVIHCSATPADLDVDAAEIDRWHRQRGWSGIGYHFVICRDGRIEPGRSLDEVGAHTRGYNAESIGICWVGGVDEDGNPENNMTLEQQISLNNLVGTAKLIYWDADVVGHRDLSGDRDCPCFDVREWRRGTPIQDTQTTL